MVTSTVERRTVRAQVRYSRVAPNKIRAVLELIRDKAVGPAAEALALTERDPAQVVAKCLASAVANAEHNAQIEESELFVAECYCDEGPTLKRWRPRARGRATPIHKRTSHVTVVLGRYTPDELRAIEDRDASTGGGRRDASEDRRRRVAKSRGEEVDETEESADTATEDVTEPQDTPADEHDDAAAAAEDVAAADTEPDDEGADDADDGAAAAADRPTVEELVGDNTKDELLALAETAGVKAAKSANKTTIAEAIVAAGDHTEEGDA